MSHSGPIDRRWRHPRTVCAAILMLFALVSPMHAGGAQASSPSSQTSASSQASTQELSPDYVIGAGDILAIRFWRHDDVSGDVVVRPDGKISLLLLDDVDAAGLKPEQLRDRIKEAAERLFENPQVTVIVKEIRSRNVYITGLVAKPGPYPLSGHLRVLQLIAMAGGLLEFADGKAIVIMRNEQGRQLGYRFDYEDVSRLRNGRLEQNIELKPGDTVIVP